MKNEPTLREQADLTVPCGYCKAERGQWCLTPKGRRAALHSARADQTRVVWDLGVRRGWDDCASMPLASVSIVIDGDPGASPSDGYTIEVEDEQGQSIEVGEWTYRTDGRWALRITALAAAGD